MSTTNSVRVKVELHAPSVQDNPKAAAGNDFIDSILMDSTVITKVHRKKYTVAASSSQSLDLVSALLDAFGTALTFASVKLIYVYNRSNSSTKQSKIGWTSNGLPFISAAGTTPFNPLYLLVNLNGITATAGTGDICLVYNDDASASADFDVVIAGT